MNHYIAGPIKRLQHRLPLGFRVRASIGPSHTPEDNQQELVPLQVQGEPSDQA